MCGGLLYCVCVCVCVHVYVCMPVIEDLKSCVSFFVQVYFANVHPKFPNGGKMSQYLDSLKVSHIRTS